MRRGNRHLVGVVMGGRSGSSRDAIMRNLLAENLEKAATKRTVAAIAERNPADANADVAEAEGSIAADPDGSGSGPVQVASEAASRPRRRRRVPPHRLHDHRSLPPPPRPYLRRKPSRSLRRSPMG